MRKFLVSIVFGLALAGCGGGDESNDVYRPPDGPPGGGSGTATQLSVSASAPSMPSDGSTPVTITAFARNASNVLVANVPVVFTATSGGLSGATPNTDANGQATANLGTAGDSAPRTITVTATSGTLTATTTVQVIAGGNVPPSVSLGSGTGANFQAGVLVPALANLSAGGSTTIQAVLQQSDGTLYTQNASVNFSSPCIAQNLARVTENPATTSTGIATVTYTAQGCSGADVITASTTVGGSSPTATGTITVAAAVTGSIEYVSATPTNIALRGTGNSDHPEQSTVLFHVVAQGGGPRIGATVNFSLNTTTGGIALTPTSAVSDAEGNVRTVVQGGTVATVVRVTATVQGVTPVLATQSSNLTVTTGIPDQDSFSLAVQCQNVEAWDRDGVVVPITARLSDRFNNPVPEGTAITIQAEGGSVVSQCTTGTGSSLGACTVNWTSSNPRPPASPATPANPGDVRAGRARIFATAIGEESFNDTNGNGSFDAGESWTDQPERFRDDNENGVRDSFEPIYDFNTNAQYDPVDGLFNGVLCLDTARCNANATTTGISASNLIIMSHGESVSVIPDEDVLLPEPTPANPTGAFPTSSQAIVRLTFADLNGNPLPAGTSVSASVVGTGVSVASPSSQDAGCTTQPETFTFTLVKSATAAPGAQLNVRTESPLGLVHVWSWTIR